MTKVVNIVKRGPRKDATADAKARIRSMLSAAQADSDGDDSEDDSEDDESDSPTTTVIGKRRGRIAKPIFDKDSAVNEAGDPCGRDEKTGAFTEVPVNAITLDFAPLKPGDFSNELAQNRYELAILDLRIARMNETAEMYRSDIADLAAGRVPTAKTVAKTRKVAAQFIDLVKTLRDQGLDPAALGLPQEVLDALGT